MWVEPNSRSYKPLRRLQQKRMVVNFDEELKVFPKLVVAVVVVAFDSRNYTKMSAAVELV